jgi:hypothetical protein
MNGHQLRSRLGSLLVLFRATPSPVELSTALQSNPAERGTFRHVSGRRASVAQPFALQ